MKNWKPKLLNQKFQNVNCKTLKTENTKIQIILIECLWKIKMSSIFEWKDDVTGGTKKAAKQCYDQIVSQGQS